MPLNVSATVGDWEVLATGSLIAIADQEICVDFNWDGEHILIFFKFSGTESDFGKQEVKSEVEQPNILRLHFINYNNPSGTFSPVPAKFSHFQGRDLYFNYFIQALSGTQQKLCNYTFYASRPTNAQPPVPRNPYKPSAE